MKNSPQHGLSIAEPAASAALSRARKQFNTLIKKVEAERLRLAAWNEALPVIMQQAETEFQPLARDYAARQKAMVRLLDQASRHGSIGKKERSKLSSLICSVALDLLPDDTDDAGLKEIYNRHSGGDFDAEASGGQAAIANMLESLLGVKMDADFAFDARSPASIFEAVDAQLRRQAESAPDSAREGGAAPRKPAAALARERREAAAAEQLKLPVRDIFRKLVSALHPDREPDAAERQRKTALMQRVNVAYEANDLLALLALQLEIEQINQAGLDNLAEERIKQYNKVLTGQLRELERESASIEHAAAQEIGAAPPRGRMTPQALQRCLRADIIEMRVRLHTIVTELEAFRDMNKLKAWLKQYQAVAASDFDDVRWP